MKIRLLKDEVINKIAAGEVIDRPFSVVKELVDNAFDAGASEVSVKVEQGGRSLIQVEDDGEGMVKDDALLSLERHATSKLHTADDLFSLDSRGFRGEALASIASVSRLVLTTRHQDEIHGTRVEVAGGKIRDVKSVARRPGTTVEVKRLFFNTPVRRKFLRSEATESARVRLHLKQLALSQPHAGVIYTENQKQILHLEPASGVLSRGRHLYKGSYHAVRSDSPDCAVEGLVGHPSLAGGAAEMFVILVNNRPVSDRLILKAVREGFQSTLKSSEFPAGFISCTVPQHEVDINVHPQKSEVRFVKPRQVYLSVVHAINEAVNEFKSPVHSFESFSSRPNTTPVLTQVPGVKSQPLFKAESSHKLSGDEAFSVPSLKQEVIHCVTNVAEVPSERNHKGKSSLSFIDSVPCPQTVPSEPKETDLSESSSGGAVFSFSQLRYVGQILACYLVCEHNREFYLVDMHAAHERVSYFKIRQRLSKTKPDTQKLLLPLSIELPDELCMLIDENKDFFMSKGFEISVEEGRVQIHAEPRIERWKGFTPNEYREFFSSVLHEWGGSSILDQKIDAIAASMACHSSIRGGDIIGRQQVSALFAQLDEVPLSGACPHGRPVVVKFSKYEIEKWFGRDS